MRRFVRNFAIAVFAAVIVFGIDIAYANANNVGDIVGQVLHTDIRVTIEDVPIMGYNFNAQTFVVVRDLEAHGFTVSFNEQTRRVDIARGASIAQPRYVPQNLHPVGSVAFNVLHTDIVTYVAGQRVDSFNIDGATVVRITDIANAAGANLQWHENTRLVAVNFPAEPIDPRAFEQAIFNMINAERTANGLSALVWNEEIAQRVHARIESGMVAGSSSNLHIERNHNFRFGDITPELMFEEIVSNDRFQGFILNPYLAGVGVAYNEVFQLFGIHDHFGVLGIYFITHAGEVAASINPFLINNMIDAGQLPQSQITLNTTRVATPAERAAWIAEYWALGGANAFEHEVSRLVSEVRVAHGLSPVEFCPILSMAARYYTQILIHLNYRTNQSAGTAHTQGPYTTSVNTARAMGATLRWGGNAFTPGRHTPQAVVDGWMNSPGHARYILDPEHRFVGMGMSLNEAGTPWQYMFMSNAPSMP